MDDRVSCSDAPVLLNDRARTIYRGTLLVLLLTAGTLGCEDEVVVPDPPGTGTVRGTVIVEGSPVSGLSVQMDDLSTTTDEAGRFIFEGVGLGTHTVAIADIPVSLLFEEASRVVSLSLDGETVTTDFFGTWRRGSALYVYLDPPWAELTVRVQGPDTMLVHCLPAGLSVPHGTRGRCEAVFVDSLRAGNYVARFELDDPADFLVVIDSASFYVTGADTASVTFTVSPLSGTLTIGDTVAVPTGPLGKARPPDGFRVWVTEGDTFDLKLTDWPRERWLYEDHFHASVYAPDGGQYTLNDIEPSYGLTSSTPGWFFIMVHHHGDRMGRGSTPEGYTLHVRPAGPLLSVFPTRFEYDLPWDQVIEDTLWVWNQGAGSVTWSAEVTDERLSVTPSGGVLPLTKPVDWIRPPAGAAPVAVRFDLRGLRDTHSPYWGLRIEIRGDDWADAIHPSFSTYVHDPRVITLWESADRSLYDVAAHPDGSVIVVTVQHGTLQPDGHRQAHLELLKVNLETRATAVIASFLDQIELEDWNTVLPGNVRLTVGADGGLYVADLRDVYRIRPDGSEVQLLGAEDSILVHDMAAAPDGTLFVSGRGSRRGLWSIDSTGAQTLLVEPEGVWQAAIAYDPTTERIYMAQHEGDLLAFDRTTGTVTSLGSPPIAVTDVAVGRSGMIFFRGYSSTFSAFDPTTGVWEEGVNWSHTIGYPTGIAFVEGYLVTPAPPRRQAGFPAQLPLGYRLVGLAVDDGLAFAPAGPRR